MLAREANFYTAGRDLPSQDPFNRNNVQNDVGIFIPRRRTGFTKTAGGP
jgi:hypothetical protein